MQGIVVGVLLIYPLIVYAGLRLLEPRALAVGLGLVLLLREVARSQRGHTSPLLAPLILIGAVLALAMIFNEGRFFLFVPVLVNLALLVPFAQSLAVGPSMVERFASRRAGPIPPEHVGYCRRVTQVWCAFFVANAAVIVALALWAPVACWALYTGLLAYLLVGALFVAELTYRSWRFRRYHGDVTDVLFRRLFPPKPAP